MHPSVNYLNSHTGCPGRRTDLTTIAPLPWRSEGTDLCRASEIADAVSRKLVATQELERKDTEIEIERKERTKREVQAAGIANAMQIIRGQLSAHYVQHEAIEAQKLMVNSPNHTTVYIPVGPMGVPLTGTFPAAP